MTTKTMTSAAGFAMSGVEGTRLPVSASVTASGSRSAAAVTVGGWRQVQAPISGGEISTAGAMSTVATMPIARNKANALPATHALPAAYALPATYAIRVNPAVKPAALPLGTTLHLVTTKDAGRGNKGSSPWRFPV
jgi:hypothetical protein